jgi:hypothetical protein
VHLVDLVLLMPRIEIGFLITIMGVMLIIILSIYHVGDVPQLVLHEVL